MIEFFINQKIITDPSDIANYFNDYFINVGKSLANNITSNANPLLYVNHNNNSLVIPQLEVHEVLNMISLLNSAAGHDCLPGSIMKNCTEYYIYPLTHVINMSIEQGYFPPGLKLFTNIQSSR